MTIAELVLMARRIHDAEGHNLGANSTRESRNAFWMRVVGCAHRGHPVYNRNPDPRWHVKNAGGGRPMSDDVAVLLPSREAWDCIRGAGASGYSFHVDAIGILPPEQVVFIPTLPDGGGVVAPPAPVDPPVVVPPAVDVAALLDAISSLRAQVEAQTGQLQTLASMVSAAHVAALQAKQAAESIRVGKAPDYVGKLWGQTITFTPKP